MINTTDLQEFEVSLPGEWRRQDDGATYSFTADKMELRDERLFRQLYISHPGEPVPEYFQYALAIMEDYCGLLIGDEEFIIRELDKKEDGSVYMEWEDRLGKRIGFERPAIRV